MTRMSRWSLDTNISYLPGFDSSDRGGVVSKEGDL